MSQPRIRKVVSSGDGGARARASVAKASGDTVASAIRPNQETLRSRSKNKIPKSVRYDLENALVSLCDVWFEEIKPHLVRNNIKLHVHGSSAGGDHERQPRPAPPAPPAHVLSSCSHLDPGAASDHPLPRDASSAGCFSTPPTASKAPCLRLRTPSRLRLLSPLPSLPQTPRDCIQTLNCEEKQLKRPRTRRKIRRSKPQPQSSWRVPRLCRTYSVLSSAATGSRMRRVASHLPPQTPAPHDQYYRFIVPRRNNVMKNKSTQTDKALLTPSVSVGCQKGEPGRARCSRSLVVRRVAWQQPAVKNSRTPSPGSPRTATPSPGSPKTAGQSPGSPRTAGLSPIISRTAVHSPGMNSPVARSPCPNSPATRSPCPNSPATRSTGTNSPGSTSPAAHCPGALSPVQQNPPSSGNARSPSPLSITRQYTYRLKRSELADVEALPLFPDDLIDIIGERNDKRLRLLYSSPEKDDYPSFMNLFPLPNEKLKKPGGYKKNPPWR